MASIDESSIFVPHRCVGRVFGNLPAVYFPLPKSTNLGYISFPIKNTVYTYKVHPLCLVWTSEPFKSDIRVIARDKGRVFAADEDGITLLNFNGTKLKRLLHKKLKSKVNFLIPMGSILICIEESGFINVVDVKTGNILVEIETPSNFTISSAIHPETYYNKVRYLSIKSSFLSFFRSFWALLTDAFASLTSIRLNSFTNFSKTIYSIARLLVWFNHQPRTLWRLA
jgi:hypothetical protein